MFPLQLEKMENPVDVTAYYSLHEFMSHFTVVSVFLSITSSFTHGIQYVRYYSQEVKESAKNLNQDKIRSIYAFKRIISV